MLAGMKGNGADPEWLRIAQAAGALAVSASTVRRWADSGRLACRRTPSGQRRFRREEVAALLAAPGPASPRPPRPADGDGHYRMLFETSLEVASSLELGEVLQSAARRLGEVLAVPDCDIYRLEGDESLVCLASAEGGVQDASWVGHECRLAEWHGYRLAVATRSPLAVASPADPRLSELERAEMRRYGQRSSLVLPLIARDKVIGLVDLSDRVDRTFSAEEIAIVEAGSRVVALALEHAQLYDEVKRLHLGNLRALSSALSAKDYYTLGHAGRVAAYALLLGRELGWP